MAGGLSVLGRLTPNSNSRVPHLITGIGSRAVSLTLKPLTFAASAAAHAGMDLERATVDRALESPQFERLLSSASNSERIPDLIVSLFDTPAAKRVIDGFFDSGLFNELVSQLLESEALWELVDRLAGSPAVTAAISQQGLGFADQVGEEVRMRARKADNWLERTAYRLPGRRRAEMPLDIPLPGQDPGPVTP